MKHTISSILPFLRNDNDVVSVVTFNRLAKTLINGANSQKQRLETEKIVNKIEAKGSTIIFPALEKSLKVADGWYINGGNNLVILATDGKYADHKSFKQFKGLMQKFARRKIKLIILAYGHPSEELQKKLSTWATRTGGFFTTIDESNVDDAVLRALEAEIGSTR
jgi:hypothetical protein